MPPHRQGELWIGVQHQKRQQRQRHVKGLHREERNSGSANSGMKAERTGVDRHNEPGWIHQRLRAEMGREGGSHLTVTLPSPYQGRARGAATPAGMGQGCRSSSHGAPGL